jgi:uncharacterized protein (DUF1684 family)
MDAPQADIDRTEEWRAWHIEQDRIAEEAAEEQYKLTGTWWINVYRINRRYGGPEEGGWWFDTGEPVASIPVKGQAEARQAAGYWRKRFPKTDCRYSSIGGEDHDVMVQDHFAESFPRERPHYE